MATANMNMTLPTVGGSTDTWGTTLNTALEDVIDVHDHTSGKGVRVPSSGLNINADLTFAGNSATNLEAVAFAGVASYSTGMSLWVDSDDNELYWRTSGGTDVQITNGAALDSSTLGGITGDYSTTDADVEYDDGNKQYKFMQDDAPSEIWAKMKCGDIHLGEDAAVTTFVRLQSPSSLSASYDWIYPAALPAAEALVSVDASGNLAVPFTLPSAPSKQAKLELSAAGAISTKTSDTLIVPAVLTASGGGWSTNSLGHLVCSTNTAIAYSFISGLPVGARVTDISVVCSDDSSPATTVTVNLYKCNASLTGLTLVSGTGGVSGGTGAVQTVTRTLSSPETVTSGLRYMAYILQSGTGSVVVSHFEVALDFGA